MALDENSVLIDWLTFSTKKFTAEEIINNIGLAGVSFARRSGLYGYKSAYHFGGMWIMFDGADDMGVCVQFSGQGCRQYETSADRPLIDLIDYIKEDPGSFNITRVDVAYDDIDREGEGLLNVQLIDEIARKDLYISKFRTKSGQWSGIHKDEGDPLPLAYSVYFGGDKSDVRFRIYDKALERGGLDYHWVRFELQLRHGDASNFLISPGTVGYKFVGLLNNYIRFVDPSSSDTNRRRWPTSEWWSNFLSHVERVSVYAQKDIEYNLSRLERYIYQQAGNSILTYINCVGLQYFLVEIKKRNEYLASHQRALVEEYEKIHETQLKNYRNKHPWG